MALAHKGFNLNFRLKLWPFYIHILPYWLNTETHTAYIAGAFSAGYLEFVDMLAAGYIFQLSPPQRVRELQVFKGIYWRKVTKTMHERALNDQTTQ